MLIYIITGLIVLICLIGIIGLILPKERIESRQSVINKSPEIVYNIVINNDDYSYRSDLKKINILNRNGDMEEWEEISKNGNTIIFRTKEKNPYSFYSFDMNCKMFRGYWTAEFKETDQNRTLFIATEYIRIKNPFIKTLSYLFFNIGKFMETYQKDLKTKCEDL